MIKNKPFITAHQNNFSMHLIVLTIEELVHGTYVLQFSSDEENSKGYQRPLLPSHFRKITKYLQGNEAILPPAILTASEPENIEYNQNKLSIVGKLRVVDGQHRIAAFRQLREVDENKYGEVKQYEIPVIIMVIPEEKQIYEINTFININSKGKKVSTDLAIRLREQIRDRGEDNFYLNKAEVIEDIATKITKSINANENSVWYNTIKVGPEQSGRIISINAFNKSLFDMLSFFWEKNKISNDTEAKYYTEFFRLMLIECWDLIMKKWSGCFNIKNEEKYNSYYNIQKGIGVNSLHIVLTRIVRRNFKEGLSLEDFKNLVVEEFENVLNKTTVNDEDWMIGGEFMGFASRAGFNLIADRIMNKNL
ncbi:DGQHR domain-containing protein [Paenibacillus sp. NPDC093718]|uniref:DGQHR domain-containing protein n=1 Tax=Paenibacillus sp. NPDC093718 TaxID=3390601 RepID=UPI003D02EE7C